MLWFNLYESPVGSRGPVDDFEYSVSYCTVVESILGRVGQKSKLGGNENRCTQDTQVTVDLDSIHQICNQSRSTSGPPVPGFVELPSDGGPCGSDNTPRVPT